MFNRFISLFLVLLTALVASGCSSAEERKQQFLESGNRYFDEKKYGEAIVAYQNALREDPRLGETRYKLAQAYENMGDGPRAFGQYIRAADLLPDNSEVQLKAASFQLRARRFEDAKTRVERVLTREPNNVSAQTMLGVALAGLRDLPGAIAEIEQAIAMDPSRGLSYTNLAFLKAAQGDREQAGIAFRKAVELDPKSVDAQMALAQFQWTTGDVRGSEETFKVALAIDPTHPLANRALAALYVSSRRAPEAEVYLRVIANQGPPDGKIALADYYIQLNRLDDARAVLTPLVGEGSARIVTTAETRLAQIEYAEKRSSAAHAMLDKVLARNPNNSSVLQIKAQWLIAEGKTEEAFQRATKAVAADSQSATAHFLLGTLQAARRDPAGATQSFTEVLRLNPNATAAQLELSRLNLARGDSANAVQFAEEVLTSAPASAQARFALVRALLARRDTDRAQIEIGTLVKQYPDAAPVHALNGSLRLLKADAAGARAAYERALTLDPTSMEALRGITGLDLAQKRMAAAQARVDARLAAQPDRPELLVLAARLSLANRDFAKTEQTLRRVIQLDPSNTQGFRLLAQTYFAQRRLDAAQTEFEGMIRRNPKDLSAHTMAAIILSAQNKNSEAMARYEEALRIDPNAAIPANNLAYLYANSGENLDRALSLAQAAVRALPDNPEVRDTLGWVYYRRDVQSLAIGAFEESIAKDPDNPAYHYHLGLAYTKSGNLVGARRSLQTALKLKPDYTEAQGALKALGG